jgi:hypothetical protein
MDDLTQSLEGTVPGHNGVVAVDRWVAPVHTVSDSQAAACFKTCWLILLLLTCDWLEASCLLSLSRVGTSRGGSGLAAQM